MRDSDAAYGAIPDGAIGIRDGLICWLGRQSELPGAPETLAAEVREMRGAWMTPGLIDCHTHLVFGGNRSAEFERRASGKATYTSQSQDGDGILSTVRSTRESSLETLTQTGLARAAGLIREGVTTLEIKSGYGLDRETELRLLSAAAIIGDTLPVDVRRTYLGAHALPSEFAENRKGYIDFVVEEMVPQISAAGMAEAVDAFCESVAFSTEECERVLAMARHHGLGIHLHADQLSESGGAQLAARMGALSADHLEYTSEAGVRALAESGTIAVLLPGAFHFLGGGRPPPVAHFRQQRVPMALATDLNPGSSPILSLLLALGMGVTLFHLTPEEALQGVTVNAARALGLEADRGQLDLGLRADLAIWDIEHPRELAYWMGGSPLVDRVYGGASDGERGDVDGRR